MLSLVLPLAAHFTPYLDAFRYLAACRVVEHGRGGDDELRLFSDEYAHHFTTPDHVHRAMDQGEQETMDLVATRFLDDMILLYVTKERSPYDQREYNQVVLVGDPFDTRPYRLNWPENTVIYLVADPVGQREATAACQAAKLTVKRGCMLRRVDANLRDPEDRWYETLERSGFVGNRLSVWVIQGLVQLGFGETTDRDKGAKEDDEDRLLEMLFSEVADGAARTSVVFADIPVMSDARALRALSANNLLGGCLPLGAEDTNYGRIPDVYVRTIAAEPSRSQRWLVCAEQQKTSLREMDDFYRYGSEMDDAGEDWDASWNVQ